MFRVSDVIDLPIVSLRTGKRLCTVKSVIIDMKENMVFALLCKESMMKKHCEIVQYNKILLMNYNQITVFDKSSFKRIWSGSLNTSSFIEYENIIGKFVINSNRELIGTVTDIYFHALNGTIDSFELSEGYFDDFVYGRKLLSCKENTGPLINQVRPLEVELANGIEFLH